MEIVFQNHDAPVSARMRRRAEQLVRKVAKRMPRAVDATIRFQQDGATRRVEITLHGPSGRRLVARSEGRYFGTALNEAARRLGQRVGHTKRTPKSRARELFRRKTA